MAAWRKSTKTARLIVRGGYQYVILPKELEFSGDRIRIRRVDGGVFLEPMNTGKKVADVKKWFAELDRHRLSSDAFEGEWRNQPQFPPARKRIK